MMNAVYELVTRDSRGPSGKLAYRVGAIAGIVVTVYLIFETLYRWPQYSTLGAVLFPWAGFILVLLPPAIATVSALVAAHHARRIDFALLKTTPLTPTQIAWGFVQGALFHNRVYLALCLPLLAIITIGELQMQIETAYRFASNCDQNCIALIRSFGVPYHALDYFTYPYQSLIYGAVGICIWLSALPAACIGMYFGLVNRFRFLAAITAFVVTVIVPVGAVLSYALADYLNLRLEVLAMLYLLGISALGAVMFERSRDLTGKLRSDLQSEI